ncbi:MAG: YHYH protein [Candidatus Taylorbacteria bacterium]|nr:YHYH protein [Candidatus Taylorbacteria bacterium]
MFAKLFSSFIIAVSSFLGISVATSTPPAVVSVGIEASTEVRESAAPQKPESAKVADEPSAISSAQKALAKAELLALAGRLPETMPLGDGRYSITAPKKGYIYLCDVPRKGGGAQAGVQTWIKDGFWNPSEKASVAGSVSWPAATFSSKVSGSSRSLSGNGLPISHVTGTFPVSALDPAYVYDRNPNAISAQSIELSVPAGPVYSDTPYCMGMEVGVMLSGVPIFAGFDAELRDAAAYEVQDSCAGHPEKNGQYHYHSLSECFKDASVSTVLGYAFDGFPITGPKVAEGKYLMTEDLDVCHGIVSEVVEGGETRETYHYVMTRDFPYSVSCFRGKPAAYSASSQAPAQAQGGGEGASPSVQGFKGTPPASGTNAPQPPQEAIDACSGKERGDSCSFSTPRGAVQGACDQPPERAMSCIPR